MRLSDNASHDKGCRGHLHTANSPNSSPGPSTANILIWSDSFIRASIANAKNASDRTALTTPWRRGTGGVRYSRVGGSLPSSSPACFTSALYRVHWFCTNESASPVVTQHHPSRHCRLMDSEIKKRDKINEVPYVRLRTTNAPSIAIGLPPPQGMKMRRKRGWVREREGEGGRENLRLDGVSPALSLTSARQRRAWLHPSKDGNRTNIVIAFDVMNSTWPLDVTFPIFWHRLIQFLAPANDEARPSTQPSGRGQRSDSGNREVKRGRGSETGAQLVPDI